MLFKKSGKQKSPPATDSVSRQGSVKSVKSEKAGLSPVSSISSRFKLDDAVPPVAQVLSRSPPDKFEVRVTEPELASPPSSSVSPSDGLKAPKLKKRISTIVEDHDSSAYSDDTDSVSESDSDDSEEDDSGSDREEDHRHVVRMFCVSAGRTRSISATKAANEEAQHSYSLLGESLKIHPFSTHFNHYESVIDEHQLKVLNELKKRLENSCSGEIPPNCRNKTLYSRYGLVTDVIGRGAYGTIKVIDPNIKTRRDLYEGGYYAVKELVRRKDESTPKYADRVISEFICACRLSNKHISKYVDLMVYQSKKGTILSAVMELSTGGDLFHYLTMARSRNYAPIAYMSLEEIDCFVKQIAKGLFYMHQHGVAHCDLKLENILVHYRDFEGDNAKVTLKLGDFGQAQVTRTSWETHEQLYLSTNGPIGSEPYMAPEEHKKDANYSYSLLKKDNWSLGVIALIMFHIRRMYYPGLPNREAPVDEEGTLLGTCPVYVWSSTANRVSTLTGHLKPKDRNFAEYLAKRMVADYDTHTKEWLVKRAGAFDVIENLFKTGGGSEESISSGRDIDELGEIRRYCLYKLLDPEPSTRMTAGMLLKSDWLTSVDSC
ncbi:hypothetical protein DIURU_003613 [Diutina rugosa]|uniref:Protein kinase domain-containing protein n=1 Tax=Diutina rugosa TaxID=5481 RepID=A0A642ULR6_DIURU|nr:uncharacterized protein DIURU_003613 [Diutina rugosa]KAA8901243.1 hypothetical protein DIURU_003613 [Diutina rugosa]